MSQINHLHGKVFQIKYQTGSKQIYKTINYNNITMGHQKTTSSKVATTASKALRSKTTSKTTKTLAGTALSQKHKRGSKK